MAVLTLLLLKYVPLVVLFLVVRKIIGLFLKRWKLQRMLKDFPGPKPHFLWGNSQELSGNYDGMLKMTEYAQTYDGAYQVWMGPADAQLISVNPATARVVLSGSVNDKKSEVYEGFKHLLDPKDEFSYALMRPWIGDGLLLSKGRKWDRNRRMMTPAFHVDILKNYVSIFSKCTAILTEKWRRSRSSEEVFHHISLLTLDSMMQCLFGFHSNCQSERTRHPYIQGVYDVSDLIVKRIVNPLHHYDCIYYNFVQDGAKFKKACETIHNHSNKIIEQRKQLMKMEKKGTRNLDFLDILLSAKDGDGVGLSDKEIRDEVDTFMFEGHDSTASTISWCLHNLAKHPEWQTRCRQEIREKIGDKPLTWEGINKLEYVSMCIHESMRLYPAVPTISRCLERDLALSDGRVIPKDTRVAVSLFAVQRDPEVWDNPSKYDPERFSPDKKVSSVYHLPFSVGPRNCIGQQFALTQVRVVICELVRNFQLDIDPEREAEPECLLILRSKNGLYLKIKHISP